MIKVARQLNSVPCSSLPLPRIIVIFGVSQVNTSPSSLQRGEKKRSFRILIEDYSKTTFLLQDIFHNLKEQLNYQVKFQTFSFYTICLVDVTFHY